MPNGTIHELKPGCLYRVRQDFTDFYGGVSKAGIVLTFQNFDFLPYHGGYTVNFGEKTIYFQEEANASIVQDLWSYLEPLS
jgi:hypothetical protein